MRKRWILLAEDDANDAALALTSLERTIPKNSIITVADGAEALDYLYRRGKFVESGQGRPCLVLLDLKMPKLDGIEVLRQIKGDPDLKTIPVVMFTSSKQESDVSLCYELGANAYVVKPVDFVKFRETIESIASFWARINELSIEHVEQPVHIA
jgi:CheY-like chemotaxis protein